MSKSYQGLYCDESGTHKSDHFHFGALCGSPRRAEILRDNIFKFRREYECTGEMKWTKVSEKMLPSYKAFVDIFFNDDFAYFQLLKVRKGSYWKRWAPEEEERFFKAYYFFLRGLMSPYCRYEVYLDHKPGKPYRWESLKFAINRASERDYGLNQKQIYQLKPYDSKDNDLIQLVDVLLGGMVSEATATAKVALAKHIIQRSAELTRSKKLKIKSKNWSPHENTETSI